MSNPWENSWGSLLKYEWDEGMIWNNYSELLTIHMWKKISLILLKYTRTRSQKHPVIHTLIDYSDEDSKLRIAAIHIKYLRGQL